MFELKENKMRTIFIYLAFIIFGLTATIKMNAQTDSLKKTFPKIELSGFMDVFYVYDFNEPLSNYRQIFLYNHNRHNAFNLNLGLIKISALHQKYRANLALLTGTYANDNYAGEPGFLKNLFEANAGIALSKKNKLWIDAGVFASHLGFESAISQDNWTLTRSILSENSPYYLTGAKLSYTPNHKIELIALICNGWQHIQRIKGISLPSFGTQIKVTPGNKFILNWSTFIGTDDPDSTRRMRYFNNFYTQLQFTEKVGFIAGFDIGIQQKIKNSLVYDLWFSPVLIIQFALNNHWKTAVRGEYYQDQTGIIILTGTSNGFRTSSLSFNLDYSPANTIVLRLEGRWMNSKDKIFETKTSPINNNFIIATSVAIKFSEILTK